MTIQSQPPADLCKSPSLCTQVAQTELFYILLDITCLEQVDLHGIQKPSPHPQPKVSLLARWAPWNASNGQILPFPLCNNCRSESVLPGTLD